MVESALRDRAGRELPVLVVTVVHVEGNYAKPGADENAVEGAATHGLRNRGRQPLAPLSVQLVVEPRDRPIASDERWGETERENT